MEDVRGMSSMKGESQVRILYLLQFLYHNADEMNPVSTVDILRFWESHGIRSERKQVYKDISLLQDVGVDVICIKSTQNRYFVGKRLFELPELKLLVDAVESSHFITRKKSSELIRKLAMLTSQAEAEQLNRPLYMEGTSKPENETIYYNVDAIHSAIQEKRKICFQYIEYTPERKRVLKHDGAWYEFSPYALMWQRDYYYAVGYSKRHGKVAQFRVDRMVNTELLQDTAVSSPDFDPAYYASKVFGMYDDHVERITLMCENQRMRSIVDRFGIDVETKAADANHFIVTVEAAPSPPFFAWVFTFGGGIRIIEPVEVLEKMRQMAHWLA